MTFQSLGLTPDLLKAVEQQEYTEPTPIQTKAIPQILEGRDVLGGAQTGTGKTAAFSLPLLQRLQHKPGTNKPRALIVCPTRELAGQILESLETYGAHTPLTSAAIFGGVKINPQISKLRRGVDIIVATPGRLLDHLGQNTIDLSRIEYLILDEADRMLDMGFIKDIRKIITALPPRRQNMLFSATFSREIKKLAGEILQKPVLLEMNRENNAAETVNQAVYAIDKTNKRHLLAHLIKKENWYQVLVFTRTKHGAKRLAKQLNKAEIPSSDIHGNKSQAARTRALAEFKAGKLQALIATDIAARGLDINALDHVVNFDLPDVPEDYVHRIGRTGRAGSSGRALSLFCPDEQEKLRSIEKLLRRRLPREEASDFTPPPPPQAGGPANQGTPPSRRSGGPTGGPTGRPTSGRPSSRQNNRQPKQQSSKQTNRPSNRQTGRQSHRR